MSALFKGLESIIYIGVLLLIFFYIYAIVGLTLFGDNDPAHFGNLHLAAMTLFQCVTLDNWGNIMQVIHC